MLERPRRRYGGRDATMRLEGDGQVSVSLDQEAVAAAVRQLGWRVYVTTPPPIGARIRCKLFERVGILHGFSRSLCAHEAGANQASAIPRRRSPL